MTTKKRTVEQIHTEATGEDIPDWAKEEFAPQVPGALGGTSTTPTQIDDEIPDWAREEFADTDAPKRDYQAWEVMPETMKNLGPNAMQALGGLWHAVTHPDQTVRDIRGLVIGGALNLGVRDPQVREWMAESDPVIRESLDAANAEGKRLKDNYLSGYENFENALVERPAEVGMDLSTVAAPLNGRIGAAAAARGMSPRAIDAAAMLANPTRMVEGPVQALGHAGAAVRSRLHPREELPLALAEGQESALLAQLQAEAARVRAGGPGVPGSIPNAGQAVVDVPGSPTRWQTAVKDAEINRATDFKNDRARNNQARLDALDSVIPHPDLPAAITARNAAAARDYANAGVMLDPSNPPPHPVAPVMTTADSTLLNLLERPEMNEAIRHAQRLASSQGRDFQIGTTAPGGTTTSTVVGPNGRPITVNTPPTFAEYPAQSLHELKLALDKMIENPESHGIKAADVRAIRNTRNQFITWMEAANPAYRVARERYRDASRPISQSELLNFYRAKLTGLVDGDDAAKLNANAIAGARDNAFNRVRNGSISKATGDSRFGQHERDLLTPDQIRALDAIEAELSRDKRADEMGRLPSQHRGEIKNAPATVQAPSFLNAGVTIGNALLRMLTGHISERNAGIVSNALRRPDTAAEMLEQAMEYQARNRRFDGHVQQIGRAGQRVNRVPYVHNALRSAQEAREERERRNAL